MGVNLTPIIIKRVTDLDHLKGRSLAVDAFNVLHQFLALIRTPKGTLLMDQEGRVTSHLVGLAFRTTRLISEFRITPIFIYDGEPPKIKNTEKIKRKESREKAEREYKLAIEAGDYRTAFSKAVMTGRLTTQIVEDSKRLLELLGIPWIQAPSEGEAQAAYMAKKGEVWAVNSRDYDSILFGAPRLVRYVTIQGEKWLPSKERTRRLKPEIIELQTLLEHHKLTIEQLIDIAIMVGTDFNPGVRGIGPKKALRLVKKHVRLEDMPQEIAELLPRHYKEVRNMFLHPKLTDNYRVEWGDLNENELYSFLCDDRSFSKKRVALLVERMKQSRRQRSLNGWIQEGE